MAHLDKFIQAMMSRPEAELRFSAGTEPALLIGGKRTPLMASKASAGQVRQLVAEVMGHSHRIAAEQQDAVEFTYHLPSVGSVLVSVSAWRTAPDCRIRRTATPTDPSELGFGQAASMPPALGAFDTEAPPRRAGSAWDDVPAPAAPDASSFELEEPIPARAAPPEPWGGRGAPQAAPLAAPMAAPLTSPSLAGMRSPAVQVSAAHASSGPPIDDLFRALVEHKGSDLHLTADETPMIRKDGDMMRLPDRKPLTSDELWRLLEPIVPERNRKEYEDCNDSDFAYEVPGLARFRANLFRDRMGVGAVFRVIPSKILTVEQLNVPQAICELGKLSKGLVLVTGPTGSGKSTTLAAVLDLVNRTRSGHIITIEDPIEFVHPSKMCLVNQREVHVHTGSFKRALRAALREDPDILLVGEMRDLETIAIAIETAETGHLVFGTLHTTTAYSTVDRIIDQFPTDQQEQIRIMLSESLKGVVSQTLCRKIGGGRVAALEVLIVNKAVSNLIREGKTFQIPSIMQTGKNIGMKLMNDALFDLVKQGLVEPDEAYIKAVEKTSFITMLNNGGFKLQSAAPKD